MRHLCVWIAVTTVMGVAARGEDAEGSGGTERTGTPVVVRSIPDPLNDLRIRCTDPGAIGCLCMADPSEDGCADTTPHNLPNLRRIRIGTWAPDDPAFDLFAGAYEATGLFFRLELVLEGLVNPPGPANFYNDDFVPYLYGDHPVFGFVELDMDNNIDTGGELDDPQFRYLGNVGRFGGLPFDRFDLATRAAKTGNDLTVPFGPVHRSGEEFHLVLEGGAILQVVILRGNNDMLFEPGEAWMLSGEFFHRAHGYDPFGLGPFACGGPNAPGDGERGGGIGAYIPMCQVRFDHRTDLSGTYIDLVFPLTNEGAALVQGLTPGDAECLNADANDQASVLEALDDLQVSGDFVNSHPSGDPREAIIVEWANQVALNYLDPTQWDISVALGSMYPSAAIVGPPFVWTDVNPDVVWGDFNANGEVGAADNQMLRSFVEGFDGAAFDEDGTVNGSVVIRNFATNFVLFDVNYDGAVNDQDLEAISEPGDINLDGWVNLQDFATFTRCFGGLVSSPPVSCAPIEARRSDLDDDGLVSLADFAIFAIHFGG